MSFRTLVSVVLCACVLAVLPGISGCDKSIISGVAYKIEPNIETVKLQLNFSQDVESDLGGSFPVKDYGSIEIEPSTPDSPFNVGFRLNLALVYDGDFTDPVKFKPVRDLPSGQVIPIQDLNRAMVQVKLKNEINQNFDVYAYIDVVGKEWIGLAMTLKFLNTKYFPAGLSISKNFLKDESGRARGVGAVFGPKVDGTGHMLVPGGIALFGNVAALLKSTNLGGSDKGSLAYFFDGPTAPYYRDNPRSANAVGEAFKTLLKANSHGGQMM